MSGVARVAVVAPPGTREICFSPGDWRRLEEKADTVYYDHAGWDEGQAALVTAGAHVVLTGWGTGGLTEAVLAPAPDLGMWMHAAGSMAPLATDAVWRRDLILSTSNDVLAGG